MSSLYEQAGGDEGMHALAHAWHVRCLADPVAAHPFEHGIHREHTDRLAAYWGESLGGPAAYTAEMGDETRVTRMHAGQGDHTGLDRAAIACFDGALDDVGITAEPLRTTLHDWFVWHTGRLSARPDGDEGISGALAIPGWDAG